MDNPQLEQDRNRFEIPGQPGAVDIKKQKENRESLEKILAAPNTTEELKTAVRRQLAAMDRGEIASKELIAEAQNQERTSDRVVSSDLLEKVLNKEVDLTTVDRPGAGFDISAQLIENAKKRAEQDRN